MHKEYLTYSTDNNYYDYTLHTPSHCQIEDDPPFAIGSKHFHQKYESEDSLTQCPGEGGQEEVVQKGSHSFAGNLVERHEHEVYEVQDSIMAMLLSN